MDLLLLETNFSALLEVEWLSFHSIRKSWANAYHASVVYENNTKSEFICGQH